MSTSVFRRSLQWTVITLCVIFVGLYAWIYFAQSNELPNYGKASDFQMTDTEGKTVQMNTLNGKARIVYFFFANCPDVCPPTTRKLVEVQKNLKADGYDEQKLQLISITVDPKNDNPTKLKDFARKNGVDFDNWSFLVTADEQKTTEIAKAYEVGVVRDADNRVVHNNQIALIDQQGNVRQYYEDLPDQKIDYRQIEADVKQLFK
jgi:protein SCO1/2